MNSDKWYGACSNGSTGVFNRTDYISISGNSVYLKNEPADWQSGNLTYIACR